MNDTHTNGSANGVALPHTPPGVADAPAYWLSLSPLGERVLDLLRRCQPQTCDEIAGALGESATGKCKIILADMAQRNILHSSNGGYRIADAANSNRAAPLPSSPSVTPSQPPDLTDALRLMLALLQDGQPVRLSLQLGTACAELTVNAGPPAAPPQPAVAHDATTAVMPPPPALPLAAPPGLELSPLEVRILRLLCVEPTLTRAEIGQKLDEDPDGHLKHVLRNLKDRYFLDSSNNGWTLFLPPDADANPAQFRKTLAARLGTEPAADKPIPKPRPAPVASDDESAEAELAERIARAREQRAAGLPVTGEAERHGQH